MTPWHRALLQDAFILTSAGADNLVLADDRHNPGVDDGGKLHQPTIPHALDDTAVMLVDRGRENLGSQSSERAQRTSLVLAHQAGIANHLSGQDRRQSALNAVSQGLSLAEESKDRNSSFARALQRAPMSVVG